MIAALPSNDFTALSAPRDRPLMYRQPNFTPSLPTTPVSRPNVYIKRARARPPPSVDRDARKFGRSSERERGGRKGRKEKDRKSVIRIGIIGRRQHQKYNSMPKRRLVHASVLRAFLPRRFESRVLRISDTENMAVGRREERQRYTRKTSVRAQEPRNIFIAASSY